MRFWAMGETRAEVGQVDRSLAAAGDGLASLFVGLAWLAVRLFRSSK
jgi:hypothetical protein